MDQAVASLLNSFFLPSMVSAIVYGIGLAGGVLFWRHLYLRRSRFASSVMAIVFLLGLMLTSRTVMYFLLLIGVAGMNP